jgi:two-component system response regulator PilR (NtrC family)
VSVNVESKAVTTKVQLLWLLGVRFSVIGISLVAALATLNWMDGSSARLAGRMLWPLSIFMVASISSWWWVRRAGPSLHFTVTQISIDLLLVTSIVYGTGGAISPFLFLYLPVVMVAAVLGNRTISLITAGVGSLCYLALTIALSSGMIPALDGSAAVSTPSSGLALQIIGLSSAMVLVAVATSYLVQGILNRDLQVARSQQDLAEVTERQRHLIESLPEGMCVVDTKGSIRIWNTSFREIFSVSNTSLKGAPLSKIIRSFDAEATFLGTDDALSGELTCPAAPGSEPRRMRFRSRPLPGEEGAVVMFQDITALRSMEEQLDLQDRMARLLSSSSNEPLRKQTGLADFIGESPVMQKVFGLIVRVAKSDATVLVHGESGTGKELVARAIHHESTRAAGPFVAVNCGAIPETLLESEFFGHKRGAFTGAHADHPGLFARASGGTLFLDEIGELPTLMQAKLLRAIQERSVRPVGGDRDVSVDVRIVAATNRNLKREIELGNFREDLFYRLNVISINLPPLRERKEDIPLLVNAILKRLISQRKRSDTTEQNLIGSTVPALPPHTLQLLLNYPYPGNVRELENMLERAFVLGGSVILPEHLPDAVRVSDSAAMESTSEGRSATTIIVDESIEFPVDLERILESLERRYLERALEQSGGMKKKAAQLLGINFRSFRYRLQKFGMHDGAE